MRSQRSPLSFYSLVAIGLIAACPLFAPTLRAEEEPSVDVSDAPQSSPQSVVEKLHDSLVEAMKHAREFGFQGRFEHIEPVVTETFDLEFMGSKSVGRHWKKLSPEEKKLWLGKFRDYLTANYAGNFTDYDGEHFETLGDEPAKRNTRVVLTELRIPSDENIVFNYRLREKDGRWRIIDIYLRGTVSELALRRSDFSSTLKAKGFADLTAAVDRKIADLRAKDGS
jgi:phospholipid transport system substrate-binding protein